MKVREFINGSLETRVDAWYDWFCTDEGVRSRTKRWGELVTLMHSKFDHLFKEGEVFWKQNPGWCGNEETDTTLIQLYEADYPEGSQRICMSLRRGTLKSRHTTPTVSWTYELAMWKEGRQYPDTPCISVATITEFKKALKEMKL